MIHYLLIKMIIQIISYYVSKTGHLSHINGSKSTCPNLQGDFFFFTIVILGVCLDYNI